MAEVAVGCDDGGDGADVDVDVDAGVGAGADDDAVADAVGAADIGGDRRC